jgi:uncharacterized protein
LDRSPGSATDHIGYHALTQAALRGVVRATLEKASKLEHLPGDHHFYVTFRTRTPGVQMADYLKDKFPEEMTIVVQHQYWEFEVFDEHFEIILKFGGVPQHLRIPYAALSRFFDPSVNFGLQFDSEDASASAEGKPVVLPGLGAAASTPTKPATPAEPAEGTVVSLDAFRRK